MSHNNPGVTTLLQHPSNLLQYVNLTLKSVSKFTKI